MAVDQVGRTAELARTFGIDFFAVLFRGSQYRVESMMARLAHTQNYLLPSPSKEQVASAARWPSSAQNAQCCTRPAGWSTTCPWDVQECATDSC